MGDPLLQNLLQLKSSDIVQRRIDQWLRAFFEDQLVDGPALNRNTLAMLIAIRDYATFTKVADTVWSVLHGLNVIDSTCCMHRLPCDCDPILGWSRGRRYCGGLVLICTHEPIRRFETHPIWK